MNVFERTRVRRLVATAASTALAVGTIAALGAPVAAAAETSGVSPVVQRSAEGVTADALPTAQINGVAWDQAIVGNTVYVGGEFTSARPAGSAAGSNESARTNLMSYNLTTGAMTSWAPKVNGRIRTLAVSPDGKRLYIGGSFTQVNGSNRYRIAAFDTATGNLITTFAPSVDSQIFSISATNTAVYLGGWFKSVAGQPRERLAAVSASNGALLGWAPSADNTVNAVALSSDGSKVFVGGTFANLNGAFNPGLGSFDASTGTLIPMAATNTVQNYGNSAGIYSVKVSGSTVYATAFWFGGTGNFEGMISMDAGTGAITTMADCHGDTYDVSPLGDQVYTVSHHHFCSNIGGFPDTNPRNRWQRANAFTAAATGTVQHDGQGYHDFYGQPSPSVVNWFPDVNSGTYTGQSQGGWTTEASGKYVVQGGEFTTVNGTGQQGLVRFAVPSAAPNTQGPRLSGSDFVPTLIAVGDDKVRISWRANYDRDDQVLTYQVFRSGTSTPIYTTTATSQFWNRPGLSFTDSGLTKGKTYSYRIRAVDPSGNTATGDNVSVTTGAGTIDDSAYSRQVIADGANHYWRLDQPSGSSTAIDWAGGDDLTLGSGVSQGTAGAIGGSTDQAATFDGTENGSSANGTPTTGPDTFSAEAWFKTTSTSGGKIVGFGGNSTGTSGSYDRHVYMSNDGRVTFGVYPFSVQALTSAKSYNDGQWHHVVASMGSGGMRLYVDGKATGGTNSTTTAQPYTGYWRVGGDNTGGWPNAGSSNYFAGQIDDVAVYPTALSLDQARQHYTLSGRDLGLPKAPADAYGKTVFNANPDLYWRLDDTNGTAADAGANEAPGTYAGGYTQGVTSSVGGKGTAVTFNGSDGTIASNNRVDNPTVYSEELWFNTTTTHGGKLIGFGDQPSGYSGNYDRHVYMTNDGKLTFGTWTGFPNTITTDKAYNDGAFHHLVATQGSDGMKLYVDGQLVGTNAQTQAQAYSGYWRVGGDSSWGGDSSFFAGTIDEVAVYSTVLSASQVSQHYLASPAAVNAAPTASFTSTCTAVSCTFDAGASADSDGTVASYAWDFGDGTTGTGATPSHDYAAGGSYPVKLTVTDNGGATGTTTQTVTVTKPNAAPKASFTSTAAKLKLSVDASDSTDSDGTVAGYAWDFGDNATGTGKTASHTYAAAGTYTVKLTVTDDKGATDVATKSVTVSANAAPKASFTSTAAKLKLSVDAGDSTDSDGTVASYAWDFGDGATGTGKTAGHTYAAAGTYAVKLTVTDDDGATDSTTKQVTVSANAAPKAAFTATTDELKASVDGSGSTDSDGSVASYAWDFGDGANDTGKTASHSYAAAGTYTVKLTVTDDDGATDTTTKSVTVTKTSVLAADTFSRTGSRWGTAETGGAWTDSGSSQFATSGGKGVMTVPKAGGQPTASLNGVSATDVSIESEFAFDRVADGGGEYYYTDARRTADGRYVLVVRVLSDKSVRVALRTMVGTTETTLKEVTLTGVTYAPGQVLHARFEVSGTGTTTLTGRVWKDGTTAPTSPTVSTTDTTSVLQKTGVIGLRSYLSASSTSAPVTVTVDNLTATALPR